jgi:hypothetical protein
MGLDYGDATFDEPVSAVSFYYASAPSVTLEAFDVDGNVVATSSGPGNAQPDPPYLRVWEQLVVDVGQNIITRVRVHAGANATAIDDFSYCRIIGIDASIEIKPETLNLNRKGVFTAFIDLPEGYDEQDIDISTVECEGAPALKGKMANDGRLIVKFERKELEGVSLGDDVELAVSGKLIDNTPFGGSDTIRVIAKGGKK